MKAIIYLGIFLALATGVLGAACSGAPVDNCTVSGGVTYTMPGNQVFNVNDTNFTGVAAIAGNNARIDCNGSTIQQTSGDFTNNTIGINIGGYQNVIVSNCTIKGFYRGIYSVGTNDTIQNNIVDGNKRGIELSGGNGNNTVQKNVFLNNSQYGLYLSGHQKTLVSQNNFSTGVLPLEIGSSAHNMTINNNSVRDAPAWIVSDGGDDNIISNNQVYNITQWTPILIRSNSQNAKIFGNIINISSQCIVVQNSSNPDVENNTCDYQYTNYDAWSIGILFQYSVNNIYADGNKIIHYCKDGLQIQQTNGFYIGPQNYFRPFTPEEQMNYPCNGDKGTYPTGIDIPEEFMTYVGNNQENWKYNITTIRSYNNSNGIINVTNASFSNTTMVYLHTQGCFNCTINGLTAYDSSTNWYRKFAYDLNIADPEEYFNNPSYDYLYYKSNNCTGYAYLGYNCRALNITSIAYFGNNVNFYDVAERAQVYISKTQINITAGVNRSSINNASINTRILYLTNNVTIYNQSGFYPNNDISMNGSIQSSNFIMNTNQTASLGDYVCDKHYRDSGMSYTCVSGHCTFTTTNCTIQNGRTN